MDDVELGDITYRPTRGARRLHRIEIVDATEANLKGYGCLVEASHGFPIEIVRWPAQGWRPVDQNSGDQGGVTEGVFEFWWKGDTLYARNNAVGDSYLFAWSTWPEEAAADGPAKPRQEALIWRANYHPDGGQLFYPIHGEPFIVPLALPGDDVKPEDFVAFRCDGSFGIHIDPGVWHQPMFPFGPSATFDDKQGRVHACIAVNFVSEFGCYLEVPLG